MVDKLPQKKNGASLTAEIEAAALNQTEDALRELVQVALNVGLGKPSLQLMLRSVADDLEPKVIN